MIKNEDCLNVPKPNGQEKQNNSHPTVKPLKLMSYLITLGSREGDVVLDPFAGSGTTLLAAKNMKRKYIGCELSTEYYKIIESRLTTDKPSHEFFG
jgi:DNA modification methylase